MAARVNMLVMLAVGAGATDGTNGSGHEQTSAGATTPLIDIDQAVVDQFEAFLSQHGRRYEGAEYSERLSHFHDSLSAVEAHSASGHSHSLAVNSMADMGPEEFAADRLGLLARRRPPTSPEREGEPRSQVPASWDWRSSGVVGPVLDQGRCGACWAFASAQAIESAWKIATGSLVEPSVQQLIDCASGAMYGNHGCQGGAFDGTFAWAEGSAICTASSYPYEASLQECSAGSGQCQEGIPAGSVVGFRDVASGSEQALMRALMKQPVAVGISVSDSPGQGLKLYSAGVFSGSCSDSEPNHAVLLVGYGSENGQDYWLLKNSWGSDWGENGFFRMARGEASPYGKCAILSMPSYPLVQAPANYDGNSDRPSAPTPSPAGDVHSYGYGSPPCLPGEAPVELSADFGATCAPACGDFWTCSEEAPPGTAALPECVLEGQQGERYCALVCTDSADCPARSECGSKQGGQGLCLRSAQAGSDQEPAAPPIVTSGAAPPVVACVLPLASVFVLKGLSDLLV